MAKSRFNPLQEQFLISLGLSADSDAADIEDVVSKKLIREGFNKGHKTVNQTGRMCEAILDIIGEE